jgi:threonine synthase
MHIVAPEGAPAAKLAAIRGAGGRLSLVAGGRDAAGREARRRAEAGVSFASHVWNPFFLEGTRTLAFEIWEQMGGRLPDRIFLPVGNGSLLIGAATGFEDLVRQGLAPAAPRLMAVQALACAPLVSGAPPPDPARPSVADGIRIASPPRGPRMKAVVSASGGRFLAVSEEEILEARRTLGRSGLDVEPTAAAAFAGCLAWSAREPAGGDEPPVVVLTGSGLKVPAAPSRGPEVTGP